MLHFYFIYKKFYRFIFDSESYISIKNISIQKFFTFELQLNLSNW